MLLCPFSSVADKTKLSGAYKPLTQQFIEYQRKIQRREHLIERTAIAGIYGGARAPSACWVKGCSHMIM
jgi:hypothetical protein